MRYFTRFDLVDIMRLPLPTITDQRKLVYRPSAREVVHVYELLNHYVFDNSLTRPRIEIIPRCRKYWGMCMGERSSVLSKGSFCKIRMMDKWYCPQWMVTTLAHEMAHQYQWDIEGPEREYNGKNWIMSHGPSFFQFRNRLAEHYIPLKTAHSTRCWFKHQDMFKC